MVKGKFIEYIKFEKRYSAHTVQAYTTDLNQFDSFIKEHFNCTDPATADHQMIRSWIAGLSENNISTRTINRKISSLRSYYQYLLQSGSISEDPLQKVVYPKSSKELPVYVDQTDMERLFEQAGFTNSFDGLRDRLIMELLYSTGIRLAELAGLKEADVDFHNRAIKVTGKRNKQRIIPLSDRILDIISEYIRQKKKQKGGENVNLFITKKGNKIYHKMIYRIVHKYLALVTTISRKSPHVIRHSFATHMLNRGADLNAIKELLGHANLSATQVYTHNTIDKLKTIYKQAHPRASKMEE